MPVIESWYDCYLAAWDAFCIKGFPDEDCDRLAEEVANDATSKYLGFEVPML